MKEIEIIKIENSFKEKEIPSTYEKISNIERRINFLHTAILEYPSHFTSSDILNKEILFSIDVPLFKNVESGEYVLPNTVLSIPEDLKPQDLIFNQETFYVGMFLEHIKNLIKKPNAHQTVVSDIVATPFLKGLDNVSDVEFTLNQNDFLNEGDSVEFPKESELSFLVPNLENTFKLNQEENLDFYHNFYMKEFKNRKSLDSEIKSKVFNYVKGYSLSSRKIIPFGALNLWFSKTKDESHIIISKIKKFNADNIADDTISDDDIDNIVFAFQVKLKNSEMGEDYFYPELEELYKAMTYLVSKGAFNNET